MHGESFEEQKMKIVVFAGGWLLLYHREEIASKVRFSECTQLRRPTQDNLLLMRSLRPQFGRIGKQQSKHL